MFKSPSSRRRSGQSEIQINLVPMLDALVTLIAFLLFSMSFLALVSIESPAPVAATSNLQDKMDQRPLQLTLSLRADETRIWSPFERVAPQTIPHLPDGQPDLELIHSALIDIKQKFPGELKLVLAPHSMATYDTLIALMDAIRMYEKTDPPLYVTNPTTGVDEEVTLLFPEIVFGNLLGDN